MVVHTRREGATGYVELDTPPVNAMGHEFRQGLLDAVDWVEVEGLERVIVSGRGRLFSAGGDAREFDDMLPEPSLPDILNRIEQGPVPWIAAAHGAALGGGLELMLACRYRVAAPGTQLGLPEVTLGVVPGAGGTQRLPRLVGLERALALIPTGRAIPAEEARAIGLIDEIDANPVAFAELANPEWLAMKVPVSELNSGELPAETFEAARRATAVTMPGQTAPQRAIDLIEASQHMPIEAGLIQERAAFLETRRSAQAKALRHVFFAERAARRPARMTHVTPPGAGPVAVIGGAATDTDIAYALLLAGLDVTFIDPDADGLARAAETFDRHLGSAVTRGLMSEDRAGTLRAALTLGTGLATATAPLVIEAVPERMEAKTAVFAALQTILPSDTVLATTTACLDLDAMAQALDDPTRLVGLHFSAPAHETKLLEIVPGARTSDTALAMAFHLAGRLRKTPVVSGPGDGLICNRLLGRYVEAADTVLMDGSTPWEVDEAMVEFGFPTGPFEAQDLSGLDLAHAARRRQDATRDPNRRYIPVADRMVELGKLGRKTGAGWYRYPGGGGKVDDPIVADLALEEARYAGVERCDYKPEEIRHRLLLALINEAADILYEGIARSATDIDLVSIFGLGFPRWRGGLMFHADTLGPGKVLEGLKELSREDPVAWKPSPMIEDCAARGIRFGKWRR